jgi:hypothetical protein
LGASRPSLLVPNSINPGFPERFKIDERKREILGKESHGAMLDRGRI